jgi:hypothetical protein
MTRWFMMTRNNPPHWKHRGVFFGDNTVRPNSADFKVCFIFTTFTKVIEAGQSKGQKQLSAIESAGRQPTGKAWVPLFLPRFADAAGQWNSCRADPRSRLPSESNTSSGRDHGTWLWHAETRRLHHDPKMTVGE